MSTKTVDLVATSETVQRYFPEAANRTGILSAPFPIDASACRTALGRWLAETIHSTRFDDDASRCAILLPHTHFGLSVRDLGERISREYKAADSLDDADRAFDALDRWISEQRKILKAYGPTQLQYCIEQYRWPVFGSTAAEGADTPEAYFDRCASAIRATGGVILRAGLSNAEPPASLVRTMAAKNGGGDTLLRLYQRALAAGECMPKGQVAKVEREFYRVGEAEFDEPTEAVRAAFDLAARTNACAVKVERVTAHEPVENEFSVIAGPVTETVTGTVYIEAPSQVARSPELSRYSAVNGWVVPETITVF